MKRIFLVALLALVLGSCKKDEGDKNNSAKLSPPNWIQGTWFSALPSEYDNQGKPIKFEKTNPSIMTYTFTKDNIMFNNNTTIIDYSKNFGSSPGFENFEEVISSNRYELQIKNKLNPTMLEVYELKNNVLYRLVNTQYVYFVK